MYPRRGCKRDGEWLPRLGWRGVSALRCVDADVVRGGGLNRRFFDFYFALYVSVGEGENRVSLSRRNLPRFTSSAFSLENFRTFAALCPCSSFIVFRICETLCR